MAADDKRVAIKRGENQAGTRYALTRNDTTNTYEVWIRKANYNGRVRGGIEYSWRYVQLGMDLPEAEALYDKRLQGKAK